MSFPLSPTNNQIATLNGINYQYNSATTSWTISAETNWLWAAPTPMPTDGQQYSWDKTNQVWTTERLF